MEIDSRLVAASLVFLLAGSFAGSAVTFSYMDQRVTNLEQKVQNFKFGENSVSINYTREQVLTDLFNYADQSVVSVNAYGNKQAQASGFVYRSDGYIVTNEHVVSGASRVEVGFLDGSTYRARVVGTDPYTDLAVLKVNRKDLEPLQLADSSKVEVGQRAVAIGNPFGLRSSMTSGIVSQKGRTLRTQGQFSTPNVIQTDAAINPGNSGGPLLNLQGEIIGVNTAIESRSGTFSGVGFAIPSNTVKNVVPSLIKNGENRHPWIGVSGIDVNPEIAERMNLKNTTGFLVVSVVEDSPADRAGLQAGERTVEVNGRELNIGGDVIVGINDEKVRGISDILLYLSRETEVGETVTLEVIRDGERIEVPLTL
ncbi:MAG: S1C family serine protease, partial [Candidatus Nanohaloarchaea archaeon]